MSAAWREHICVVVVKQENHQKTPVLPFVLLSTAEGQRELNRFEVHSHSQTPYQRLRATYSGRTNQEHPLLTVALSDFKLYRPCWNFDNANSTLHSFFYSPGLPSRGRHSYTRQPNS